MFATIMATILDALGYRTTAIQHPAMILDDHAEAAAALLSLLSEQPGLDKRTPVQNTPSGGSVSVSHVAALDALGMW